MRAKLKCALDSLFLTPQFFFFLEKKRQKEEIKIKKERKKDSFNKKLNHFINIITIKSRTLLCNNPKFQT